MILFYSEYCQHCNILLETLKRHDKNNIIKLVSIDLLRSLKKPIDPKIHSVPALLLIKTKEYLFGKAVFDYLLLPNRGILFSGQLTRDEKKSSNVVEGNQTKVSINEEKSSDEPGAFSLGSISSDNYASIENDDYIREDTNYKWDLIDKDNKIPTGQPQNITNELEKFKDSEGKHKLPSMEDIMKQRAMDIK